MTKHRITGSTVGVVRHGPAWRAALVPPAAVWRRAMRLLWTALLVACASVFTADAQNLIQNGGFDNGLAGWSIVEVGGGVVSHSSEDAGGSGDSGSAQFDLPGGPMPQSAGLTQCAVVREAWVDAAILVGLLPADDCADATFFAEVSWFESSDCSGGRPIRGDLLLENDLEADPGGVWHYWDAPVPQPPADARSALIATYADLRKSDGSCRVRLDNVFVGTEEDEPPPPAPDLAVMINAPSSTPIRYVPDGMEVTLLVEITNVGDAESSGQVQLTVFDGSGHFRIEAPEGCSASDDHSFDCSFTDLKIPPGETFQIPVTIRFPELPNSLDYVAASISSPGDLNPSNDYNEWFANTFMSDRNQVPRINSPAPRAVAGRNR